MNLPIDDDGVRPAGKQNECFYCQSPKGQHKDDCVCVKRTVVLRMTVDYVIEVPRSWSAQEIEDHRNLGSFCLTNDIWKIAEEDCHCGRAEVSFVREATAEDVAESVPEREIVN